MRPVQKSQFVAHGATKCDFDWLDGQHQQTAQLAVKFVKRKHTLKSSTWLEAMGVWLVSRLKRQHIARETVVADSRKSRKSLALILKGSATINYAREEIRWLFSRFAESHLRSHKRKGHLVRFPFRVTGILIPASVVAVVISIIAFFD